MPTDGGTPGTGHTLTWRQRKILNAIRDSVRVRGYPPSLSEIGETAGLISTASVSYQLDTLERAGYIKRDPNRPRALELRLPSDSPPIVPGRGVPAAGPALAPIVTRIAPDVPLLAAEQIDDVWPLPRQVAGDGPLFILQIPDESMTGAAITRGDWVVVRRRDDADDGDIVAAALGDETAVRTFRLSGGHAWLVPHHPDYQPVLADAATILGTVTAVLRLV